jgi:hypothetical protein
MDQLIYGNSSEKKKKKKKKKKTTKFSKPNEE